MEVRTTAEFDEWRQGLFVKTQALVDDRLDRIVESDHFGDARALGGGLFELKWKSGLRVYFGYVTDEDGNAVLVVMGGDKNGQNRDIRKARIVLARETA